MKPAAFEYHRVFDADEAVQLLGELGDEAKILAGGQSLTPMMNFRLARPTALIDINQCDSLNFIRRDGDTLTIGALTRHHTVEMATGTDFCDGYEILPQAAPHIGHYPIRTRGTFGGSIAHSDPSAEWCVLARLLDATIVLLGPDGTREVPAAEWFTGFLTTAIADAEIVLEIRFARPRQHAALAEFAQRQGDFAIASAAVAYDVTDGVCTNTAVVLGAVASEPFRIVELDEIADGLEPTPDTWRKVAAAAPEFISPADDLHGDSDYRRRLAKTMVERAFNEAASEKVS